MQEGDKVTKEGDDDDDDDDDDGTKIEIKMTRLKSFWCSSWDHDFGTKRFNTSTTVLRSVSALCYIGVEICDHHK